MDQFHSPEEEDEYWERRIAEHPFSRMMSAMYEMNLIGCHGERLRKMEKEKADLFWRYWNNGARDWLKDQGKHGTLALDEIGDEMVFASDILNLLSEADLLLLNSGMYEERVSLNESLLSFFQWKDDRIEEARLRANIGETLEWLGRKEECDSYFRKLIQDEPDRVEYINSYLNCLCERKSFEEARGLLERHLRQDMEITEENDILYWRAEEIYKGLGDFSQAEFYRRKREKWERNRPAAASPLNSETAEILARYPNILEELGVKADLDATATKLPIWMLKNGEIISRGDKKIYPNDLCPCGSGKKFKKCCGKKG